MSTNTNTTKRDSFILFLLWPFFAVLYAIRNYKANWAKDIIWLFVVFYGFTVALQSTNGGDDSIDAYRYRLKFRTMAKQEISFDNIANQFYDEEGQYLDVMELTILFVLSRFTDNFHILFATFGLIFGYFYSRNIWYLVDRCGKKINRANIPIIITFAFIVGFWQLNGFRFWSATHMFFFGTLPFLYEGKKKYLWVAALSIFMHFAYFLPLMVLGIYLLAGRRTNVFFVLFIITFFFQQINLTQAGNFLSGVVPQNLLPRVKGYTNEEYAESLGDRSANVNWYAAYYTEILRWAIVSFIILIYFRGKQFIARYKGFEALYSFALLMYTAANVFALIPSGGRYITLANLFSMAAIFFYIQFAPREKTIKKLMKVALPAFAIFSIVSIRLAFDTMGFFSVFGNPLLSMFFEVNITLIDLVKGLLGVGV